MAVLFTCLYCNHVAFLYVN